MRWFKLILLVGLILVLLSVSFRQTNRVCCLWSAVSLRYVSPLTPEQVASARTCTEETPELSITFWAEESAEVYSTLSSTTTRQISFSGDAHLAYPAEYLYGRSPSSFEPQSCAVSSALAWALWGSQDVTGLTLTAGDDVCQVVGVFSGDVAILLRLGDSGFTAAELRHIPDGEDAYRWAERFATASGLGQPDWTLWGAGFSAWTPLLPWSCAIVPGLWLVGRGAGQLRRLSPFRRSVVGFGLAFLLTMLLPTVLQTLPAWLLPTQWSDLSHWHRLSQTLQDRLRDLLALYPCSRDVAAKSALVCAVISTAGCHLLSAVLFRVMFKPQKHSAPDPFRAIESP